MTAFIEVQIIGPYSSEKADALVKAIKGLAKGTLTLDSAEVTTEGLKISYHRTKEYTFHKKT